MTYSKEFLDLYNNLFAVIPYPEELADEVLVVAELWREFCALPQDVKSQFTILGQHEDWNSGYIARSTKENHDEKEYYHFQPNHLEIVSSLDVEHVFEQYPVVKEFLESCDSVVRRLKDFVHNHASKLAQNNEHLRDLPDQFLAGFEKNYSLLRFLHYTPDPKSELLAEPHFDIGGMTFHVYENSEGLQFMDWDGSWKDAPLIEGSTVMFNAYGLESMSDGVLQRTWHRVVPKEGQAKERYSGVFFADFPDNPNWDTTKLGRAKFQPMEYREKKEL